MLVYAEDGKSIGNKEKHRNLTDGNKEVGLEVNAEKAKVYVAVSSPQCRAKS
jgi:hypothetical protein